MLPTDVHCLLLSRRIIFLETVAGVPGMMGAMVRHLQSLRRFQRDYGWIHTLLGEPWLVLIADRMAKCSRTFHDKHLYRADISVLQITFPVPTSYKHILLLVHGNSLIKRSRYFVLRRNPNVHKCPLARSQWCIEYTLPSCQVMSTLYRVGDRAEESATRGDRTWDLSNRGQTD